MTRVFVSHSHADNAYCRRFVATLHQKGLETWYDENNLGVGEIEETIVRELKTCDHYIVILSPASLTSEWVSIEMNYVLRQRRHGRKIGFLPVVAAPCEIPPRLAGFMRVLEKDTPEIAADSAYELLVRKGQEISEAIPEVRVIKDADDYYFDQFFALYNDVFPPDERSAFEDMARYISEAQEEAAKPEPEYMEELPVVALNGEVVAFMNYTLYYDTRYVFISYIAINKETRGKNKAVMKALLTYFRDRMQAVQCRGVVFEVENKNFKRDAKRKNKEVEISRIRRFGMYLTAFAQVANTRCYEVDFNFIQPFLLIEEVQVMPNGMRTFFDLTPGAAAALGRDKILSLGFIPFPNDTLQGKTKISKRELLGILRFVYEEVYGDSFIDDERSDKQFKAYMRRVMNYYRRTLPARVDIK